MNYVNIVINPLVVTELDDFVSLEHHKCQNIIVELMHNVKYNTMHVIVRSIPLSIHKLYNICL